MTTTSINRLNLVSRTHPLPSSATLSKISSTMASEGSREIEAARQRLATAKKQAAFAAKVLEAALAMSESAKEEVRAAHDCLRCVEERWEVIDVVDSEDESLQRKRRKVSASPGGNGDARVAAARSTLRSRSDVDGRTDPEDQESGSLSPRVDGSERGAEALTVAGAAPEDQMIIPSEGGNQHPRGRIQREEILVSNDGVNGDETMRETATPACETCGSTADCEEDADDPGVYYCQACWQRYTCKTCDTTKDCEEDVDNPGNYYCQSCWEQYESATNQGGSNAVEKNGT